MRIFKSWWKAPLYLLIALLCVELALQGTHFLVAAFRSEPQLLFPDAPVILCIGDSHTYGTNVAPVDSFPSQLQTLLVQRRYLVNVVNLGFPSANTSQLRRLLPEWLNRYHPALVVILAGVNNEWNRADIMFSDLEDGVLKPGPRTSLFQLGSFLIGNPRTARLVLYTWNRFLRKARPFEETQDRAGNRHFHEGHYGAQSDEIKAAVFRTTRDLAAIVKMVRVAGAQPVLMTYPGQPFSPMGGANAILRSAAASLEVPLVDNNAVLWPMFMKPDGAMDAAAHDKLFVPGDLHLAGPGYAVVAANVFQTVAALDLLRSTNPVPEPLPGVDK